MTQTLSPPNKGVLKSDNEVAIFIAQKLEGFSYAGNYTGADGRVDLKCDKCGTIINRSMISVRHSNIRCNECYNTEIEEQKRKTENRRAYERNKRQTKADSNKFNRVSQIQFNVCPICETVFYTTYSHQIYCSKECYKKSYLSTQGSDDRLNKSNIKDRGITLKKLYERDEGICQICGKKCDWLDYYYNDNGIFIAGNNYPSKDHIIPLSKGGLHAWDNVRLTHKHCNELRGAKV
jgi:hypothetical protein